MKKLITGVLATLACFACLTGCDLLKSTKDSTPATVERTEGLANAKTYVNGTYREDGKEEVGYDYVVANTAPAAGKQYPITWSVTLPEGVTSGVAANVVADMGITYIDVDETLTEDLTYTLTATIGDVNESGATEVLNFERKVLKSTNTTPPTLPENGPAVDTAYKLHVYSQSKKSNLYATGKMSGYYFGTATDPNEGADFYIENATDEGTYYLYTQKDSTKSYVNIIYEMGSDDKMHNDLKYEATATSVWTYSDVFGTLVTTVAQGEDGGSKIFSLGTDADKTYATISAQDLVLGNSFKANLVTPPEGSILPPSTTNKVAQVITEKPVNGQTYKLYMEQTNADSKVYFSGSTESADVNYRFTSSTLVASAVDVLVEYETGSTDAFYLSFMKDGVKTYINIVQNGNFVNSLFQTTKSAWAWDATAKTMVVTLNEKVYTLGADNRYSYTTISSQQLSYTPFMARLATLVDAPADGGNQGGNQDGNQGDTSTTITSPATFVPLTNLGAVQGSSGLSNDNGKSDLFTEYEFDNNVVTITADAGTASASTPPKHWKDSDTATTLRIYTGSSLTISVASGYEITSIVFTTAGGKNFTSASTIVNATAEIDGSTTTLTPSADDTTTITINVGAQIRISQIVINFASASNN